MNHTSVKVLFVVLFALLKAINVNAQVVVMLPEFATQTDNVTITFDASKGNAALLGQTTVYAHTGLITNLSPTPNSWRYVQGNWGTDDSKVKMTNLGGNKFQISYHIPSFYGVPAGEKVLKLAFVFRNQSGSLVGKNADGSDIFVDISDGNFQVSLFNDASTQPPILNLSQTLSVTAKTSAQADISILVNEAVVATASNQKELNYTLHTDSFGYGRYVVKTKALVLGEVVGEDSFYCIIRPNWPTQIGLPPAGTIDGINYVNDSTVILQLFAPSKNYVYAIGDFNNWELNPAYELTRTPDGNRYWIQLSNLLKSTEYGFQYCIDKEMIRVADYYSDKLLDQFNDPYIGAETYPNLKQYPVGKTSNYVSVFQTMQTPYNWQVQTFSKPDSKNLIIYELLVRDFIGKHDYKTLIDTLDYLKNLGINAIELMPINEFEGNESWGYNTAFYFAPDKYYGTKNDLKAFVDACHQKNIAVIMDIALNHSFGQSSMVRMYWDNATGKPASNSPWFNADATHPYNVGYDFNHESIYTQLFVDTVLKYWMNAYKIDGFRFDLSKGFTQKNSGTNVGAWSAFDQSRINNLKRMYNKAITTCADCYYILEHFADNSEETVLANHGFMLWGNNNYNLNEATMGYPSDLSGASYKSRGWSEPKLVSYAECHDEERLMFKNLSYGSTVNGYNVKDTNTALARNEAAAVVLASIPGPYMLWQFGELGYDYSINYCTNGTINENCRTGNKPIKWNYLNKASRKRLYDVTAAINKLKLEQAIFSTADFSYQLNGSIKQIQLNSSNQKLIVLANMGTTLQQTKFNVNEPGYWFDYFNNDSILFTPDNQNQVSVTLKAGEYKLLSNMYLGQSQISTSVPSVKANKPLFYVYPNPTSGLITVSNPNQFTHCTVTDLTGRICFEIALTDFNNNINLTELGKGIYFITCTNGLFSNTQKILINK